jgi:hypothetical protein
MVRVLGFVVFCIGMFINIKSDKILQAAKAKGQKMQENDKKDGKVDTSSQTTEQK